MILIKVKDNDEWATSGSGNTIFRHLEEYSEVRESGWQSGKKEWIGIQLKCVLSCQERAGTCPYGTSHLSFRHCLNKWKDFNEHSTPLTLGQVGNLKSSRMALRYEGEKKPNNEVQLHCGWCVYLCSMTHSVSTGVWSILRTVRAYTATFLLSVMCG